MSKVHLATLMPLLHGLNKTFIKTRLCKKNTYHVNFMNDVTVMHENRVVYFLLRILIKSLYIEINLLNLLKRNYHLYLTFKNRTFALILNALKILY